MAASGDEQRKSRASASRRGSTQTIAYGLAILGAIGASAISEPVEAAEATTFCGNSSQASKDASVWKALRNYQTWLAGGGGDFTQRSCIWCHNSTGNLNNDYVKGAFEVDILGLRHV